LGSYPLISLQAARDRSYELRRAAREGRDVAQAFEQHFAQRQQGLKNAKHIWQWRAGIGTHAFPRIGSRPILKLKQYSATAITKLAFEFLILTAARSAEVRLAQWAEIDEEARQWVIPAKRIKAGIPHVVPLAHRCLEILRQASLIGSANGVSQPVRQAIVGHGVRPGPEAQGAVQRR